MAKCVKWIAALSVAATCILAMLYKAYTSPLLFTLAITFGTTAYHFCMRLAVGHLLNMVMRNRADYTKKRYRLLPFEEKLYRKLNVKSWKGRMPTYAPASFSLREHTLEEVAGAMCQAEDVHAAIVLLSFLPIFASPRLGSPAAFVITSVLAASVDTAFIIMQRYNRARLVRLINRQG